MIQKLSNRFRFLDSLIRKRATGSPKELAQRLGITERAWHKVRDELVNDLNLPLAYDPVRKTYYYTEEGQFVFGFQRKLSKDDLEKLDGGRLLNISNHSDCQLFFGNFLSLNFQYSTRRDV